MPLDYLTPEERQTLLAYVGADDMKTAEEYYESIKRDLQARYKTYLSDENVEKANEHKFGAAMLNIGRPRSKRRAI
jgi:4-alpha-glucanotransferase